MLLLLLSLFVLLVRRLLFDGPGRFCLRLFRLRLRVGFRLDSLDFDGLSIDGLDDLSRRLRLLYDLGLHRECGLVSSICFGYGFRFCRGFWLVRWWPGTGPVWRIGGTLRRLQHLGVHLGVFDYRRHRSFVDLHFVASTGDDRVGDEPGDQAYRTYRVVVARDHVVYDLGVAVGIGKGQHRNLEPVGFFDQELLTLGVYDEHTAGETLHLGYAGEVAP